MKSTVINVPVLLPEYGRNVQRMVEHLLTIEEKEVRNKQAKLVIATMANVYPHTTRDTPEFRNMLYDHLFMISGFQLDVDCEFALPTAAQFSPVPQKIEYPQQGIVRKQYGSLVPRLAREIGKIENQETKKELAGNLARFMRQKSYDYNGEFPNDDIIIADLYDMSNGHISVDVSVFNGAQLNLHHKPKNSKQRQSGGKKSNNKSRHNNGYKQKKY